MQNIFEIRNSWFSDQVKELGLRGITQADIANKLEVKPQYINAILHGRQNASERFAVKFCQTFDINQNTLLSKFSEKIDSLTNNGKKLNKETSVIAHAYEANSNNGIPLIGLDIAAGFGSAEFAITDQDIQALYVVPDFSGIDFMIRVKGNSMYPKYSSGDIVACRKIKESSFIQWNKCHVIATKEQGLLVKRLKKSSRDNFILAVSDNLEYDPFEIPKEEVTGIALVIGVIRLE